jgi:membrane fusion protein
MNAPAGGQLFRKEVMEHRADRLHGDVHLAVPLSWQLIGYLMFASVAAAIIFLSTATYTRVESVQGAIVLDKGVAPIMPSRPGVVTELAVREGQSVRAGDPLVRIRAEEDMASGPTLPRQIMDALAEQDRRLATQGELTMTAAAADQARLAATIAGLSREIASLDTQIAAQQRLVQLADNEFRASQGVAGRGFISRRDLETREGDLVSRRQQLAQLEQARAAKSAELTQARRAIAQTVATAEAQAAGVLSSRAELGQQRAQAEAAQGYTLTSPLDGTVTAVTVRAGQPAASPQPMMVVMPAGARPRAELYVPTTAAGFLQVGQEVRLAIGAFPYQRFGTVAGRIVEISGSAVPRATAEGSAIPVYIVTAELPVPWVTAFGRRQPLLPGMTLDARIVTQERSLVEWLFEPLFAVRRR